MRCPVCSNIACTCSPEHWDRVVRKSFEDAAKWKCPDEEDRPAPTQKET